MAAKIVDITKYSPKSSDIFFFDNNVWMYLFCPLANYNKFRQKHYSSFLQSVNTSKSTIFISSLILSEFSNRYLRMDFEQWKDTQNKYDADFKADYVGTTRYKDTVIEIKRNVNQIMKFCEKSSDNFNAVGLEHIFNHFVNIDFNDSYYLELAKLSKWKIVTDDSDFVNYTKHDVEVITLMNN
jgi:hypothetical protein